MPQQSAQLNHRELDEALSRCASVFTKRRRRRFGELERAVKSAAKRMAQTVATEIDDRKLRSQVRASSYNQLAPMLRAVSIDRLTERVRYRKTVMLAAIGGGLFAVALACLFTFSKWAFV